MKKKPLSAMVVDAWRLYIRQFSAGIPLALLLYSLPTLLLIGIYFFAYRDAFQTLYNALSELTRFFSNIESYDPNLPFYRSMPGDLLLQTGASIATWGISLALTLVLQPSLLACLANQYSRGWHGVHMNARSSFTSLKNRHGKPIVLMLLIYLFYYIASFAIGLLMAVCIVGGVVFAIVLKSLVVFLLPLGLALLVIFAAAFVMQYVTQFAILAGVNEDQWNMAGIKKGFIVLKKRFGAVLLGFFLLLVLEGLLLGIVMIPCVASGLNPLVSIVCFCAVIGLFIPLQSAYSSVVYYDYRVIEEGYAPKAAETPIKTI